MTLDSISSHDTYYKPEEINLSEKTESRLRCACDQDSTFITEGAGEESVGGHGQTYDLTDEKTPLESRRWRQSSR